MWTLLDEYIPLKKKGGEKVKTPMNFITLHSKEYMDYIRVAQYRYAPFHVLSRL